MKTKVLVGMLVGALSLHAMAGEPTVTSVTARQRYPWNGLVDITVTIRGTADDATAAQYSFVATNSATKTEILIAHISCNGTVVGAGSVWTRKFIWDAKADIGAVKIDDVALSVDASFGVQLWENGPYWAECNVGATKPEERGYYFWWGDTVGYTGNATGWGSVEDSKTIRFSSTDTTAKNTCGQYDDTLLQNGWIDAFGNLTMAHDAARHHLGGTWRMPTSDEIEALVSKTTRKWEPDYKGTGVAGTVVTGKNGKSIFLPVVGYGDGSSLYNYSWGGYYWSSTPYADVDNRAWYLYFDSGCFYRRNVYQCRFSGLPVRPVRVSAE